ncbi:fructose-1,6-biphosphate aldolase, partial [Baffinella frigidus]
ALSAPGKGILAADESTGTIGKRFAGINVENTEENRIKYREMLFTAPNIEEYIAGVIVYDETIRSKASDGEPLCKKAQDKGILIGIKMDKGMAHIPGTRDEHSTQGLDDLAERCKEYFALGARFAKWRATFRISPSTPSACAVQENAWALARYGAICQASGLVPIIEPEILMDGDHDIERTAEVAEHVQSAVYKAMKDQNLLLEGTLLKPSMVTPGKAWVGKVTNLDVAAYTVRTMQRTVPVAVPGVVFLSGGQSEEEATSNLNAMNTMPAKRPWSLSFSFGRALQSSCLKAWSGEDDNLKKAQTMLVERCRANSDAQLGRYLGGSGETACLFQSNYKY